MLFFILLGLFDHPPSFLDDIAPLLRLLLKLLEDMLRPMPDFTVTKPSESGFVDIDLNRSISLEDGMLPRLERLDEDREELELLRAARSSFQLPCGSLGLF